MPSRFYDQDVRSGLKNKRKLSAFLDGLVSRHRKGVKKTTLTYIFCSDEALLEINKQFLNHDTYTDIITFDLSESDTELVGEIYISTDRILDNAAKFQTERDNELHRVIFHGALHLCGFKDKTKTDREEMRRMEEQCLKQYSKEQ